MGRWYLKGSLDRTLNYWDNGFRLDLFHIDSIVVDGNERPVNQKIKTTGYYAAQKGVNYQIYGETKFYGKNKEKQIAITDLEPVLPTDADAVVKYLSSGMFKGVGSKLAKCLVKEFGEDTLETIKNSPELLTSVKGISAKKAQSLHETYIETTEYRSVNLFFNKFDVSPAMIKKIFEKHGKNSVEQAKVNPYAFTKIKGIGFKQSDLMARKLGLRPHMEQRVEAGVVFALQNASISGHCYLTREQLISASKEFLNITMEKNRIRSLYKNFGDVVTLQVSTCEYTYTKEELNKMMSSTRKASIVIDEMTDQEIDEAITRQEVLGKLVINKSASIEHIYLDSFDNAEQEVANKIKELVDNKVKPFSDKDIEKAIRKFETIEGIQLEEKQKEAVSNAINSRLSLLAGKAGTGKSTVIKCMLYVYRELHPKTTDEDVLLIAPTGRAAKRITETTGYEASTIHRALVATGHSFEKNMDNMLTESLIICDETTMVDIKLAMHLFEAINKDSRVVLVGDFRQLPSVGAGMFFQDLLDVVLTTHLNVIKRQSENSKIIEYADKISEGTMPPVDEVKGYNHFGKDVCFIPAEEATDVYREIKKSVIDLLSSGYKKEDIQVVCPQKNGIIGTHNINKMISDIVNEGSQEKSIIINNIQYYVGDKVMHVNGNDYNAERYEVKKTLNGYSYREKGLGIFNGEIGKIIEIKGEEIVVAYDDYAIMYSKTAFKDVMLSYANTVHKSQGSEFPVVILPVHTQNYIMLNMNLGYTAITRSRQKVVLIGQKKALSVITRTNNTQKRNTGLRERIS